MDQNKPQEEDYGYNLFPERNSGKFQKGSIAESLFTFNHKCQVMLQFAMETSPYAKLLLGAMKSSGCAVYKDRHFSCEDCDGTVSGGFDATSSQIVLCQNNIHQQSHMNRVVTHELIHAFDHCRAHVDWFNNFKHLACSEEVMLLFFRFEQPILVGIAPSTMKYPGSTLASRSTIRNVFGDVPCAPSLLLGR
ncbi:mitochondrial inner membrane protease ATP23 homolog isoform X3 [Oncorhynchus mykiss]|uniref:mitochondrial inner membrane protease ATP23 homolog isoform X3 n=1 Tax=Oncorhynchus mykiss TaxID=8022 RepID=UPI001878B832|nr:mitochondrial inner membrane protease ATP23 homolog isoform X3 [Oncorhynchus mykiss]